MCVHACARVHMCAPVKARSQQEVSSPVSPPYFSKAGPLPWPFPSLPGLIEDECTGTSTDVSVSASLTWELQICVLLDSSFYVGAGDSNLSPHGWISNSVLVKPYLKLLFLEFLMKPVYRTCNFIQYHNSCSNTSMERCIVIHTHTTAKEGTVNSLWQGICWSFNTLKILIVAILEQTGLHNSRNRGIHQSI